MRLYLHGLHLATVWHFTQVWRQDLCATKWSGQRDLIASCVLEIDVQILHLGDHSTYRLVPKMYKHIKNIQINYRKLCCQSLQYCVKIPTVTVSTIFRRKITFMFNNLVKINNPYSINKLDWVALLRNNCWPFQVAFFWQTLGGAVWGVQNGSKWFDMGQYGSKWFNMVQNGSIWSKLARSWCKSSWGNSS